MSINYTTSCFKSSIKHKSPSRFASEKDPFYTPKKSLEHVLSASKLRTGYTDSKDWIKTVERLTKRSTARGLKR